MPALNETSTNTSNDEISSRLTTQWKTNEFISIGLISLFVPIILCSNILVVVSVSKFKCLQIPTNFFITSLAAADIVIALALPFYATVELTPIRISDDTLCLAANRILMTAGGVSILTLAIIAYDRYTAITYPFEYIMLMTNCKIGLLVLFSWLYSAIISWMPIITGWHGKVVDHSSLCSSSVLDEESVILTFGAIFLPAGACILFCYTKIFFIARHHARAIAAVENSLQKSIETQFMRSDKKYSKTIAIVIGIFLSLWLPYQICQLVEMFGFHDINRWLENYLMILAFCNSGVNPWVYAYQNKDFRSAYRKLFHCCKCLTVKSRAHDRRTSMISNVSARQPSSTHARLNRVNSRVVASDILYSLSKQVGQDNVESALKRRLSANNGVINVASSLPDLLKMYTRTIPATPHVISARDDCIIEESVHEETKTGTDSHVSAF